MIFSIYVNHRHPSPPPRRHLGVEEAAHLPTLFVPSERAKNSWEQAGCVPLPPRKAAKTRKALQTLAFCFSAARSIPSDSKGTPPAPFPGAGDEKPPQQRVAMPKYASLTFENSFIEIHLCQPDFLIFVGKGHKNRASFFAFPVKWAIAVKVTFSPPFRPFRRENEGRRTRRRLLAAHVQGRKCPPPESP